MANNTAQNPPRLFSGGGLVSTGFASALWKKSLIMEGRAWEQK